MLSTLPGEDTEFSLPGDLPSTDGDLLSQSRRVAVPDQNVVGAVVERGPAGDFTCVADGSVLWLFEVDGFDAELDDAASLDTGLAGCCLEGDGVGDVPLALTFQFGSVFCVLAVGAEAGQINLNHWSVFADTSAADTELTDLWE